MPSDQERIAKRLEELPPVTGEGITRRPGEIGESRYQRLSAHLRDRDSSGTADDATIEDTATELEDAEFVVDLRGEAPDREAISSEDSKDEARSDESLPS